jgi:hypothetical protein
MKIVKSLICLLALTLFGVILLPNARADESNKKTVVTFSQAVEVPGKILPAGTYTFQLLDSPSDRNIVEIFNADGSQIIVTTIAINDYRLHTTGKTVMTFNETPGDAPEALRAWFYPGDNYGQEFVYPKARAIQLAKLTNVVVPAVAVDTLDETTIKTTPILAITPDEKEVEVTSVIQTTPPVVAVVTPAPVAVAPVAEAPVAATPVAQTQELSQTASFLPLIALLGALSIGLAVGLKLLLKFSL